MAQSKYQFKTQVPLNSTVLKIRDSLVSTGGKYINGKLIDLTAMSGVTISGIADGQFLMYQNGQLINVQMQGSIRPTTPVNGQPFFDTNLGLPIWYTGSNWINCSGNVV
jgi:hypothetical protein